MGLSTTFLRPPAGREIPTPRGKRVTVDAQFDEFVDEQLRHVETISPFRCWTPAGKSGAPIQHSGDGVHR